MCSVFVNGSVISEVLLDVQVYKTCVGFCFISALLKLLYVVGWAMNLKGNLL